MPGSGAVPTSLSSDVTGAGLASMDPLLAGDASGHAATYMIDESQGLKLESKSITMSLHGAHLSIKGVNKSSKDLVINLNDIVGAHVVVKGSGANATYKLRVHWYPREAATCSSSERRVRKCSHITFPNVEDCTNWRNGIKRMAAGHPLWPSTGTTTTNNAANTTTATASATASVASKIEPAPRKKYIVVLNPFSGKGTALEIWSSVVEPMLLEADIEVQLLSTERAKHAYEYMLNCDLTGIDAILTVGGDGILFEVVNGLYMREDYKTMAHPTPVVPIPGGTGNGLAKSILYDCDEDFSPLTATFVAIKGKPIPFDLSYVQTANYTHYAFLILGWGLISDVDILSEKMRWMGEPRLYVAAVYFTLARRMYAGRLSLFTGLGVDPLNATALSRTPENVAASQLPPLDTPIVSGNGWTVMESDFILVWVLQSSHCSSSVHSGPGVKLDDGMFTVIVATNLSRFEILQLLLAVEDGSHVNHEKVKVYKALSYRLEPGDTTRGIFSLDGEVVEYGPIQASVMPSAARTLSLR